jgi:DNA-binding CsgD family transcriptional regulator
MAQGEPEQALSLLTPLWAVPEVRAAPLYRTMVSTGIAAAQLQAGDVDAARAGFDDVLRAGAELGNLNAIASAHRFLGTIARGAGEHHQAEEHFHVALETWHTLGFPQRIADALEEIAGLELDYQHFTVAARLFGAAAATRAEVGFVYRLVRQDAYQADIDALHTSMDDTELEREWAAGEQQSLEDAVELARRGRGERGRPTFGWDSLTPAEQDVADLVAQGLTNPEIAERLLMGRETVKTHVSRVLRKLGATNRTQLTRLMAERDQ